MSCTELILYSLAAPFSVRGIKNELRHMKQLGKKSLEMFSCDLSMAQACQAKQFIHTHAIVGFLAFNYFAQSFYGPWCVKIQPLHDHTHIFPLLIVPN